MVMSNLITIHERTGSLSGRRESTPDNPIVPGVKVLGIDSKNGRKYPVEVMKKALEKYEGAIVNIDHPAGSEPRSYEDRFGRLANARLESDGIYADLSYNPKHPLAEGFKWWVQNDPKAIGLSHNAQAKTKLNAEGVEEIEEIVTVESVDLVAEPATTAGLMECVMRAKETNQMVIESKEVSRKMNVKENFGPIEKVISEFSKNIGKAFYEACKAVPRNGIPKEWHSSLDHGLSASSQPWYPIINKSREIAEKLYKEYVDRVEDHRAEAKKRGMSESAKTKKLNAMEAKKRKSIRRILVAEAIKDILKVRKGA